MTENKIRLGRYVRDDLREYADERDMTYEEALEDILPDSVDGNVLARGDSVSLKTNDDVYATVAALAGSGVDYGDVIKHYLEEAKDD